MVFSKKLDGVFAKIAGRAPWTRVLGPNICCDRAINPGFTYYKQLQRFQNETDRYSLSQYLSKKQTARLRGMLQICGTVCAIFDECRQC